MSNQFIYLGSAPPEENCAQVGHEHYEEQAAIEIAVYRNMLERLFPIPPGASLSYTTRRESHDFGSYLEVAIKIPDTATKAEWEFALSVEREGPTHWDSKANYDLVWLQRKATYRQAMHRGESTHMPDVYKAHDYPPAPEPGKQLSELTALLP